MSTDIQSSVFPGLQTVDVPLGGQRSNWGASPVPQPPAASHRSHQPGSQADRHVDSRAGSQARQRARRPTLRSCCGPGRHGQPRIAPQGNPSRVYRVAKRALDIVGAIAILTLIGPIMLLVLLILTVTTRGKPLFWQQRTGYCGQTFRMFKFRTMAPNADQRQHEVANEKDGPIFKNRHDPRVTRLGRILRKTSLDETPQLFSVLRGQMSLVGPRPMVPGEVAQFQPWQRPRLAVKPGLTCLWQVSGRSNVGFEDWMRLDLRYVRRQSLSTDFKLLLRTPMTVITGHGAY